MIRHLILGVCATLALIFLLAGCGFDEDALSDLAKAARDGKQQVEHLAYNSDQTVEQIKLLNQHLLELRDQMAKCK